MKKKLAFSCICWVLGAVSAMAAVDRYAMRGVEVWNPITKTNEKQLFVLDTDEGKLYELVFIKDDSGPTEKTIKALKRVAGNDKEEIEKIEHKHLKKQMAQQAASQQK